MGLTPDLLDLYLPVSSLSTLVKTADLPFPSAAQPSPPLIFHHSTYALSKYGVACLSSSAPVSPQQSISPRGRRHLGLSIPCSAYHTLTGSRLSVNNHGVDARTALYTNV